MIDDLIATTNKVFEGLDVEKLHNNFLTLHKCMVKMIKMEATNTRGLVWARPSFLG